MGGVPAVVAEREHQILACGDHVKLRIDVLQSAHLKAAQSVPLMGEERLRRHPSPAFR